MQVCLLKSRFCWFHCCPNTASLEHGINDNDESKLARSHTSNLPPIRLTRQHQKQSFLQYLDVLVHRVISWHLQLQISSAKVPKSGVANGVDCTLAQRSVWKLELPRSKVHSTAIKNALQFLCWAQSTKRHHRNFKLSCLASQCTKWKYLHPPNSVRSWHPAGTQVTSHLLHTSNQQDRKHCCTYRPIMYVHMPFKTPYMLSSKDFTCRSG